MSHRFVIRQSSFSRARRIASCAVIACLLLCGCEFNTEAVRHLQQRVEVQEAQLKDCTKALAERDATIESYKRRETDRPLLRNITLADLFTVDRIELVSQTGGIDLDGQPGDDGVVVYLRPLDANGDTLKAAGRISVQLLDLTNPGEPRELAQCVIQKREEVARAWFGGMLTNHYTIKCAIPANLNPPAPREVHVRATFLDWLTGREFSASRTVELNRINRRRVQNTASSS